VRTERSYCRICTAQCGILVDIEDERVARVRGDNEHPVTRGYTCPKGRALGEMHHHPQRIERPLMKVDGALAPTSWEQCLDEIGGKLREIIASDGPAAVGIFYGSGTGMDTAGYRMTEVLQGAIGTPAKFSPLTIDGTAKSLVASLVGGFPGLAARPDYERAKLIIFIGVNPIISHGHALAIPEPARTIRDRAKHGEVWIIDPRHTETAKFANRHIAPRPGADYAILAYLARELLIEGADRRVLAEKTVDVEGLRAAVAPFTRQHAADVAGVTESELADLLASVRKAGRLGIETGTGVTMAASANVTQWLAWALMIITDSMNQSQGAWFHPGFIRPIDAFELPLITDPFGPGPPNRPDMRGFLGDWPCAALIDEINTGHIKAFLNLGGSMVRSFPDTNALIPALRKLEVFATMEIIDNETTALSTHVLPTKDQLERPDVTLWDFLSCKVDAQYTPAALKPVGDRRAVWWVLAELVQRLGGTPPVALPADDRAPGADDAALAAFTAHGRCEFSEIVDKRYVARELELPAPWVDAHIARFGGWRLAPAALVAQLQTLSADAAKRDGALRLIPRRQKRHLNASYLFLGDTPDILLHPSDARAAGVEHGQKVSVRSARGEIVGIACVDANMRLGVVSVPHGHADANVNYLTDTNAFDPITGMVTYSGFPVTIGPAAAA
jgi:anaerobic selenocysteine-containing dehydrogenase